MSHPYDSTCDKGSKGRAKMLNDHESLERAKHLKLPAKLKACRDGTHVYDKLLDTFTHEGVEMMTVACSDCHSAHSHPILAKHRDG